MEEKPKLKFYISNEILPLNSDIATEGNSSSKRHKTDPNSQSSYLNSHLHIDSNFFKDFSQYYQKKQSHTFVKDNLVNSDLSLYCAGGSKIISEPFLAGVISNVFQSKFLRKLKNEIEMQERFVKKSNDLYEFYQSQDINSTKLKFLKKLRETIYGKEFLNFFSKLTGIELNNTLDASVSKYVYGNRLLCHDDDIKTTGEGRRIAFIIYLVDEDWCEKDGGALELFGRDQFGNPSISNTVEILPKWNNMAFFEIGNHSYHQVAEVTAKLKDRLSIVGWFHGPLPTETLPLLDYRFLKFSEYCLDLVPFINEEYLSKPSIEKILLAFSTEELLDLQNFLEPKFYSSCHNELDLVLWSSPVGPANIRNYCFGLNLPSNLRTLQNLFESKVFQLYLQKITGLVISQHRGEIQQYSSKQYTLLHDHAIEPPGLDLLLSFSSVETEKWDESWGGGFHYIRGTESIATIYPSSNRLSLALRSKETLRFVRYVKAAAKYPAREFSFSYKLN